jgi:hypothetical protein
MVIQCFSLDFWGMILCNIVHTIAKKQAAIFDGRFSKQFPGSYFGAGVLSLLCFFDFFPPLWDLLVLLPFLPVVLVLVVVLVVSPVLPVPV